MLRVKALYPSTCTRCCIRLSQRLLLVSGVRNAPRNFTESLNLAQQIRESKVSTQHDGTTPFTEEAELGAMSQRLKELTDENVENGGRNAQKMVEEAGFSKELKRKLEARIADTAFRSENRGAFSQLLMPSAAGKGTRDIAAAQPWSGTETVEDAALRMLNDAHKPLRAVGPPRIPVPRGMPSSVDLRMKQAVQRSKGERLANARDKTSIYALSQDPNMTEKEREQMRKQMKERFTAGARPMPSSVQGLAALANERIEDAIARGQFKNIPRGKGKNIERDYTASSPFLDTTEYFMNKIIQKQEIVPPWIEKQQELVKGARVFRARLRDDWKRHAARVIASKGGSLDNQIRMAEAYAAAEATNNPKKAKVEDFTDMTKQGELAQVTATEIEISLSDTSHVNSMVKESSPDTLMGLAVDNSVSSSTVVEAGSIFDNRGSDNTAPASQPLPRVFPFRDVDWEKLELPYHTLALKDLNNLTRSYNLMAPDLAKKPYFSLPRELKSCFADVAPQLAAEIRDQARAPAKIRVKIVGHKAGGVLERFAGDKAKVYDTTRPNYGFKDFWKSLWGDNKERAI